MKRSAFLGVFTLLVGFFLGSLCPSGLFPWSSLSPFRSAGSVGTSVSTQTTDPGPQANLTLQAPADSAGSALDTQDNSLLLQTACAVVSALDEKDYPSLAQLVHSRLGVTFTPYSTVDLTTDLTFTAEEIRALAGNTQRYIWGITDGSGAPIEMTMQEFMDAYIYAADYSKAPSVGIDEILQTGNALENVDEVYEDARFVEFHYDGLDPALEGLDWCSLKVVLLPEGDEWRLIGLIHSQWTI